MRYTDLKEKPSELLQSPERARPKIYNWGLVISIIFATIFFFAGLYLHTLFFPNQEITVLVAFHIIFLVFLIFFVVYSIFGLYHSFRFGFQGDLTILSTLLYLAVSIIIIVVAWNLIF